MLVVATDAVEISLALVGCIGHKWSNAGCYSNSWKEDHQYEDPVTYTSCHQVDNGALQVNMAALEEFPADESDIVWQHQYGRDPRNSRPQLETYSGYQSWVSQSEGKC